MICVRIQIQYVFKNFWKLQINGPLLFLMIHGCRSYNERIGHYVLTLQVFYLAGRLLKNVCWPSVIKESQWEKGAVIWTRVYLSSWIMLDTYFPKNRPMVDFQRKFSLLKKLRCIKMGENWWTWILVSIGYRFFRCQGQGAWWWIAVIPQWTSRPNKSFQF